MSNKDMEVEMETQQNESSTNVIRKKYDKDGHIINNDSQNSIRIELTINDDIDEDEFIDEDEDEELDIEIKSIRFILWHIILTDLSSEKTIIKNVLGKKDSTITIKSSNQEHIKGLYWKYKTNELGVYCCFILSLDNKIHCLSNEYLCAQRCLIDFVFENSFTFDELQEDFCIEAKWDYDRLVNNTFDDILFHR
ncbi:MAG: hypothetical protein AB7V16_13750 [Vulcanibacillus sp.]